MLDRWRPAVFPTGFAAEALTSLSFSAPWDGAEKDRDVNVEKSQKAKKPKSWIPPPDQKRFRGRLCAEMTIKIKEWHSGGGRKKTGVSGRHDVKALRAQKR
ncbi:MAG: hypothetical protein ACREPL_14540 [Rhodanobacteraceae bacterium]